MKLSYGNIVKNIYSMQRIYEYMYISELCPAKELKLRYCNRGHLRFRV